MFSKQFYLKTNPTLVKNVQEIGARYFDDVEIEMNCETEGVISST